MNISQMLMSRVTPLSDYQPPGAKVVKPKRSKDGCSTNVMRHEDTIEKYRSAWKEGDVWLQTREIEKRLGMGRSVAYSTLNKWWKDYGLLERREAGQAFSRRTGYEWRFIK